MPKPRVSWVRPHELCKLNEQPETAQQQTDSQGYDQWPYDAAEKGIEEVGSSTREGSVFRNAWCCPIFGTAVLTRIYSQAVRELLALVTNGHGGAMLPRVAVRKSVDLARGLGIRRSPD